MGKFHIAGGFLAIYSVGWMQPSSCSCCSGRKCKRCRTTIDLRSNFKRVLPTSRSFTDTGFCLRWFFYFPNRKSTRTGESIVKFFFFWKPRISKSKDSMKSSVNSVGCRKKSGSRKRWPNQRTSRERFCWCCSWNGWKLKLINQSIRLWLT